MMYLGDYAEDATLHFKWNTNDSSGASITRATDGTVWVYKDDATGTEVQTGVTDTEDFDGLTGVHHCKIDLSSGAFYATGADYTIVLKASTIDGQTVNACIASFSIENRFMRGTDSAAPSATALSTAVWTSTKAGYIDAAVSTRAPSSTALSTAQWSSTRAGYIDELGPTNIPADLDAVLADTNELQGDWTNGGRLDLIIDATLADTNELQTDWANGGRLDLIVDATLADTNELQTDWANGGRLDLLLDAIPTLATTIGASSDTMSAVLKNINSMAKGNFYKSSGVYTFYDDDDTGTEDGTLLFTNTVDSAKRVGS